MQRFILIIFFIVSLNSISAPANILGHEPGDEDICDETPIDLSTLEPEQALLIDFDHKAQVLVFRRTTEQISYATKAIPNGYENNYAGWWKPVLRPLDGFTAAKTTRSKKPEYFVFWPYSPINGHLLNYVSKGENDELGEEWVGGFSDSISGAMYDITGRPLNLDLMVANDSGEYEPDLRTRVSLMIPKHEFSPDGKKFILLCE